jgi:hypothetical protein
MRVGGVPLSIRRVTRVPGGNASGSRSAFGYAGLGNRICGLTAFSELLAVLVDQTDTMGTLRLF